MDSMKLKVRIGLAVLMLSCFSGGILVARFLPKANANSAITKVNPKTEVMDSRRQS